MLKEWLNGESRDLSGRRGKQWKKDIFEHDVGGEIDQIQ